MNSVVVMEAFEDRGQAKYDNKGCIIQFKFKSAKQVYKFTTKDTLFTRKCF